VKISIAIGAAALVAASSATMATTNYDLTAIGSSAVINGAFFGTWDQRAAGSGVLHAFVRVSANTDTVQGYNTSGRPTAFDENSSPTFTHDALLSDFPVVNKVFTPGGPAIASYEFILDINQLASDPLESLNAVQIYTSTTPGQTTPNITSLGALRYNMDNTAGAGAGNGSAGDSTVTLDYRNFTGSGQADMVLYVPVSFFGATSDYVYLYSFFGVPDNNNDGFEEWAHRDSSTAVPLPQAAFMGLAGLTGLAATRRRNGR
jgi:hypothetical protein